MKAGIGVLPGDDDRWAYEIKWDGYRTLAFVDGGRVRLQSSHLHDVTATYPELGDLASGVHAGTAILDAELVVLDDQGRPRFELLQRHAGQAALVVFDVLQVDGHDTIELAYEDRRRLLDQLVEQGDNWFVSAHQVGDGQALLDATYEQDLEGVMAKRLGSTYIPGKRSPNWRKVKNRRRVDVVIGGFTTGDGNRTSSFGSLLVGRFDGDDIGLRRWRRHRVRPEAVEDADRRRCARWPSSECPFDPLPPAPYRKGATWIRPELRATIEITEFTNVGIVRHASFIQLTECAP